MKLTIRIIFFFVLLLIPLFGCSTDSDETNEESLLPDLETDIVGVWAPIDDTSDQLWQFRADGTFVDTELKTYEYVVENVDGINYLGFDREGLNITLTEDDQAELERVVGQTDYILVYQAQMSTKDTLVLDPAFVLYGSETYFGYTFNTLILQRQ